MKYLVIILVFAAGLLPAEDLVPVKGDEATPSVAGKMPSKPVPMALASISTGPGPLKVYNDRFQKHLPLE